LRIRRCSLTGDSRVLTRVHSPLDSDVLFLFAPERDHYIGDTFTHHCEGRDEHKDPPTLPVYSECECYQQEAESHEGLGYARPQSPLSAALELSLLAA
jgi:hypothetical protein